MKGEKNPSHDIMRRRGKCCHAIITLSDPIVEGTPVQYQTSTPPATGDSTGHHR